MLDPLPLDWEVVTIGELCERTTGTVQTGPFGSDLHASDYSPFGIPVIMPANLGKNSIIEDGIARVDSSHVTRLSVHKLKKDDIVFPRRGDIARYAVVDDHQVGWLCGTGCLRIRFGANEIIEPHYLGYWLGTSTVEYWLLGNAVGTTMPNLNTSILKALPVPLPPLSEQRAIAHILGSLDDKIGANRRMNETLEATARAIFKSWFVDFDPVHYKSRGEQPPGMDGETAALFPDSFEESKLGLIPYGWKVVPIGDHVRATKGLSYKGEHLVDNFEDGVPMHNLNSINEWGTYKFDGIKFYSGDYQPRHEIKPGDLIVANTEQGFNLLLIASPAIVPSIFGERGIFSHHVYKVEIKQKSPLTCIFLYYRIMLSPFRDLLQGYTNGTTVNMLPLDAFEKPQFVMPSADLMQRFEQIVAPILQQIEQKQEEARRLVDVRDVLLPKLVSGELRVGEVEDMEELR